MIDPQMFEDVFKTKTTTAHPTSTVSPIPTVVPTPHIEMVGGTGHRTLWVLFVGMLLSTIVFAALAWKQPVQKRLFHILTAFLLAISTLSYFAMATSTGYSFAHHTGGHGLRDPENRPGKDFAGSYHEHVWRQVFWAHFLEWALANSLIVLNLLFLAGASGANILVAIFANLVWVLTGLFFAFAGSPGQRWAWYAMSVVAYLVVVYQVLVVGRRAVANKDRKVVGLFNSIAPYVLVLFALYLVFWAIGAGARRWSVSAGILAVAILDILAQPVFGFWLLTQYSDKIPAVDGFWTNGLNTEGSVRLDEEEGR